MTRQSFYRALRKLKDKYKWYFSNGYVRAEKDEHTFCPITCLFYDRTNQYHSVCDYRTCGIALGLSNEDISDIVNAADGDSGIVHNAIVRNLT